MFLRRVARTVPEGQPVPDGTEVQLRLHVDDSLVTTTTVAGGQYVFQRNGNPGPHYTKISYDDTTQIISSKAVGVSGTTDVGNLPLFLRSWNDGYVSGVLNELAVTATGTSMNVTVAAGAAIVRGLLYDQFEALPFTIGAPASQPRIDRVVVEVVPSGGGENIEGRSRIVVKPGTPATAPVAKALVKTATLWEYSLATVYVDPAVSSIAAAKVTDTRVVATPVILPGSIDAVKLNADVGETIDDRVDALLIAGTNITKVYNDPANTLTLATPDKQDIFEVLNGSPAVLATPVSGGVVNPLRLYFATNTFRLQSDVALRRTRVEPIFGTSAGTFTEGNRKILTGSAHRLNQLTVAQTNVVLGTPTVTFDATNGWDNTLAYRITMTFMFAGFFAGAADQVTILLGYTGDYGATFGTFTAGSANQNVTLPAVRTFDRVAGSSTLTFRVQYSQTAGVTLYAAASLHVLAVPV